MLTKADVATLRRLVGSLYERELTAVLEGLAKAVDDWRAGRIDAFKLSDAIHHVHKKNQALWGDFNSGLPPNLLVKLAIERGVLRADEVPEPLLAKLGPLEPESPSTKD
ncbi:MAG: hypothetical protein HYX65_08170 [Gemmatimonadetes bacterium]|nr:hypothetical protein [Gemmatimonadota bacterium]